MDLGSEPCLDCLKLRRRTTIGAEEGPGILVETGEVDDVVLDSHGNYWVGGPGGVKVFNPQGEFLRSVGSPGQGPMQFRYARPVYTDSHGRVHVTDGGNRRETIIGPDFKLVEERQLAGAIHEEAALDDGRRFAVQMLVADHPDHIGYPLHITEGDKVVHSFGASLGEDAEVLSSLTAQRVLTTDTKGNIYGLRPYHYVFEVWTETGRRIAGFRGSPLNDHEPRAGVWTRENPPVNRIFDAFVDEDARLWIVIWQLKERWADGVREEVAADGRVRLRPEEDDWRTLYRSRIEAVDLETGTVVARQEDDRLFFRFLSDGSLLELGYYESGDLYLGVWETTRALEQKGEL